MRKMRKMRNKISIGILLLFMPASMSAQEVFTLLRCRQLALENNKQLRVSTLKENIANDKTQAAKTLNLPRLTGMAAYQRTSREISILSNSQKAELSSMGTNMASTVSSQLSASINSMVQDGRLSMQTAQELGALMGEMGGTLAEAGDKLGNTIKDAFHTDTRDMFVASLLLTQPIYMGGAIKATNEIARIGEEMARNSTSNATNNVLFATDNAYWLTVSLKSKLRLAQDYLLLTRKLSSDVHKMIDEGVATKADGLKIDVEVNNAEIMVTQAENGVSIAKMYLCQLCGLPLRKNITLEHENSDEFIPLDNVQRDFNDSTFSNRPETRILQNTIDISKQSVSLVSAAYRPHLSLVGGFSAMNPSLVNGFERKFRGIWNIGINVSMPIWSWNEGRHKINAAKTATAIAELELADVREKISLQVEQAQFKIDEARKRLVAAKRNLESAEENLRCANIGFKEGVMTLTNVMEAQTAWHKAHSNKTEAEIDVRLSDVALRMALGKL